MRSPRSRTLHRHACAAGFCGVGVERDDAGVADQRLGRAEDERRDAEQLVGRQLAERAHTARREVRVLGVLGAEGAARDEASEGRKRRGDEELRWPHQNPAVSVAFALFANQFFQH